jgi:hypothetical protein
MFTHITEHLVPHQHATVAEARECEAYDPNDVPCCSICDGAGHGFPGGRPCPLEVSEVTRWETDEDERMALAFA